MYVHVSFNIYVYISIQKLRETLNTSNMTRFTPADYLVFTPISYLTDIVCQRLDINIRNKFSIYAKWQFYLSLHLIRFNKY